MDIKIYPSKLAGSVAAVSSKSLAHRYLICAALADRPTELHCTAKNSDIDATATCLRNLGAEILATAYGYHIVPMKHLPTSVFLPCGQSGTTLRFLLPVVGALGIHAVFSLEGRLPHRPLAPLWAEMERMGCTLRQKNSNLISCSGMLKPGNYTIAGDISSQFVSGLMMACTLLPGQNSVSIAGSVMSKPYIQMTQEVLSEFGIRMHNGYIYGDELVTPGHCTVEGDWSNAAFFLGANALGSQIVISGLSQNSVQGDRAVIGLLEALQQPAVLDVSDTPDLVPILAVVAAERHGAVFTNTNRLRLKESDRVHSVAAMLRSLGGQVRICDNSMEIIPSVLYGGFVDSFDDHRIAMAAAIAATIATGPVTVSGAQCVEKSYPSFWEDYRRLGGAYEQHIR